MPTVWYVCEGRLPNTTNDPGIELPVLDFQRAFLDHTPQFLSKTPPVFNAASPSPHTQRVVIGVRPDEGTDSTFPFAGYCLMPDMTPADAKEDLSEIFATVTRSKKPSSRT